MDASWHDSPSRDKRTGSSLVGACSTRISSWPSALRVDSSKRNLCRSCSCAHTTRRVVPLCVKNNHSVHTPLKCAIIGPCTTDSSACCGSLCSTHLKRETAMRTHTLLVMACLCLGLTGPVDAQQFRRLSLADYRDKMAGGWIGQMAGVGWGGPTEFKFKGEIIPQDKMPDVEARDDQPVPPGRHLRRDDLPAHARGARLGRLDPPGGHRLRQQRLSALARQPGRPRQPAQRASPRPTPATRSSTSTPTTSTTRSKPTTPD